MNPADRSPLGPPSALPANQGKHHPERHQEGVEVIVGLRDKFALESSITRASANLGQRGLGYFVIHVDGRRYGLNDPEATMLAVSFDEIGRRLRGRGSHTAPFSRLDSAEVASALMKALYDVDSTRSEYLGMHCEDFARTVSNNRLMWAPDGDEAFDDGSWVFQFDVGDSVRLIAFRRYDDGRLDPTTLSDLWLPSDEFYEILRRWHGAFEREWAMAPKTLGYDSPG